MAAWNLCRFAESLIPLIDEDSKTAIDLAQGIIHKFSSLYSQNYLREFKNKLGIFNSEENDKELDYCVLDLDDSFFKIVEIVNDKKTYYLKRKDNKPLKTKNKIK